ncbi:MAG: septum formation protein Maf [Candidatus Lokiarchaeota archaeon]|nr:septum formation protein Maf [Candidatus Lokiarchaeota archaeon]
MKKIILASQSPRRIEYLKKLGIDFQIRKAKIHESDFNPNLRDPIEHVRLLAFHKALSVLKSKNEIVIGADTIVVVRGEILGKPKYEKEAIQMLKKLNNKVHEVITGLALITHEKKVVGHDMTIVRFKKLKDKDIKKYVKLKESFDAAGGYKIQKNGGKFIEYIVGDIDNVVGFPVKLFKIMYKWIQEF